MWGGLAGRGRLSIGPRLESALEQRRLPTAAQDFILPHQKLLIFAFCLLPFDLSFPLQGTALYTTGAPEQYPPASRRRQSPHQARRLPGPARSPNRQPASRLNCAPSSAPSPPPPPPPPPP